MSLAICSDLSPASWMVMSDVPWERLVTFGPPGFPAYARVRFIPDPTHQGQQEFEADLDASPSETEQWRALLQLLATETADPSDCYFGLWDGWGFPESARRWPTFDVPRGAHKAFRSFFLSACHHIHTAEGTPSTSAGVAPWARCKNPATAAARRCSRAAPGAVCA